VKRALSFSAAVVLLGVATALAWNAVRQVRSQQAAQAVCEATSAGRHGEAVRLGEDRVGPDADGRIAAECSCWSLLATEREEACVAMLEEILATPEAEDWIPPVELVRLVVSERRDAGRYAGAVELARRAAAAHPDDLYLLQAELLARSVVEGEERVLEELWARLAEADRDTVAQRLVLAVAHTRRSEYEAALRALGGRSPDPRDPVFSLWIEGRTGALANLGRYEEVERTYAAWLEKGGNPAEIRARMALRLSVSHLRHPERTWLDLLLGALEHRGAVGDPELVTSLYRRAIAHLLVQDRRDEALALYDQAQDEGVALEETLRDQIVRGAVGEELAGGPGATPGRLVFRVAGYPAGMSARAPSEGTLWLQPPADAPSDAPWEALAWEDGVAETERVPGPWPHRWVYAGPTGRPRASGSVWPASGRTVEIEIAFDAAPAGGPGVEARPPPPQRAPADGRRRVVAILPDGMDWRLAQYLRTRGELPVFDHLLETGHRAVLRSSPPLTAAAMESLVWPARAEHMTFPALVHRLGVEVGGLASVGRNPLEFLSVLLPEGQSLFETVGAGNRVAANMLFSHGLIDAGRHARLVGPHGQRRRARSIPAYRPLRPEERERYPGLAEGGLVGSLAESLAAQMDAAVDFARSGEVDLLLLRLEPLDILTHRFFGGLTTTGQDDGRSPLFDAYRYIDARLAEVAAALDADDVLVLLSDHGIRTAMEHSEDAIFVAAGKGIPRGRAPGQPDLRGVPRALAALLGVRTEWPETGVAPFLESERWARAEPEDADAP